MMSSIGMLGKPPANTGYDQLPYDYIIGTQEKDGEDYVNYNNGRRDLGMSIELWFLVDEARAKELSSYIKNELETEYNDRENIFPDEEKYGYLLNANEIETLYELIGNIDEIIAEKFTENDIENTIPRLYVLPDKIEFIKSRGLGKLGTNVEPNSTKLSLQYEIFSVGSLRQFLKVAIDNNRELVI